MLSSRERNSRFNVTASLASRALHYRTLRAAHPTTPKTAASVNALPPTDACNLPRRGKRCRSSPTVSRPRRAQIPGFASRSTATLTLVCELHGAVVEVDAQDRRGGRGRVSGRRQDERAQIVAVLD